MITKRPPLWEHQKIALEYTRNHPHPALFIDPRMGKCRVLITRCLEYPARNVLILSPGSALKGWEEELGTFGQPFHRLTGSSKEKAKQCRTVDAVWFLANKETLLHVHNLPTLRDWDAVVVDEGHWIKNPRAQYSKLCATKFRHVPHRWDLTGTPRPESILDFIQQLLYLDGSVMGFRDFWSLRAKHCFPDVTGHDWLMEGKFKLQFQEYLSKRCFFMDRKSQNLEPDKKRMVREIELPNKVRKDYKKLETEFELENQTTIYATTRWVWLRQLCGGWWKEKKIHTAKVEELKTLLRGELAGEPVVIWFTYNETLYYVSRLLGEAMIRNSPVTGDLSPQERDTRFARFQRGEVDLLLVQQAVAGEGLDLSRADTAIFYEQHPSTVRTRQIEDRIVSLNKKTILLYVYLVISQSVESDLYEAIHVKKLNSKVGTSRYLLEKMKKRLQVKRSRRI